MLEYHFFHTSVLFYKLNNLILHLLTAFCVYGIVQAIFRRRSVSFLVALLFAVHPVHWEQVTQVSGRAILLCAFFYLASFLSFLCYYRLKAKGFYLLSLGLFVLSFLSKESAVTLPLMVAAFVLFLGRIRGQKPLLFRSRVLALVPVVPFGVIAVFFIFLRRFLGITNVPLWGSLPQFFLGHVTFLRGVLTYLRLFLFPVNLHFDRSIMYFPSFKDASFILTIVIYAIFWLSVYFNRNRFSKKVAFFFVWPLVTFLPVAQFIPVSSRQGYASLAEHFLYLPSVGILVLLVLTARGVLKYLESRHILSRKITILSGVLFFLFLGVTTIQQSIYSQQELALFKHSLQNNPHNLRIRNSYALALAVNRLFAQAENQYRITLSLEPGNITARIGLGKSLCDQGKVWEGILEYEKLADLPIGKHRALLNNNLQMAYQSLIKKYRKKTAAEPENFLSHFQLGVLYTKAGRLQEGIAQYQKVLTLDPLNKDALQNLVWSYEQLKRYDEAAFYCAQMLEVSSDNLQARQEWQDRLEVIQKKIESEPKSEGQTH